MLRERTVAVPLSSPPLSGVASTALCCPIRLLHHSTTNPGVMQFQKPERLRTLHEPPISGQDLRRGQQGVRRGVGGQMPPLRWA